MSLSDLKRCHKVIGTKQVKKAIAKGQVQKVYIARDAEPYIIEPIKELCRQHQISYELAENMEILGKACGINVGSATVAVLNPDTDS
ncbi:MAG: L7Ae/L30e/S12e/Gadd45 family ribosomal protein [Syntrophomonadaceae bacterium]